MINEQKVTPGSGSKPGMIESGLFTPHPFDYAQGRLNPLLASALGFQGARRLTTRGIFEIGDKVITSPEP
jgi:hypothetical protein